MAKNLFRGSYQDLQDKVLLTGVGGQWKDLGNQKQYRAETGAVLNWWGSSKTISFQGDKTEAEKFEAIFNEGSGQSVNQNSCRPLSDEAKIFIVHGHDTVALEQLELILRRLKLTPYILQNSDGQSRTLIEALEQQIYEDSVFGIILMTPDDYGYPKDKTNDERQPRARQNVILEAGMVMASLGRNKVAIVKKGHLELPSDLQGIIRLEFNDHIKEVTAKLAKQMKSAGIEIEESLITEAVQ